MPTSSPNEPVCAFCDSKRLGLVMDFGEVGLAGAFLKPEQFATERTFPMRLHFCKDCYAVQVTDKVPADVMFKEGYFYFSSSIGTLRDHFREYAAEATKRFLDPAKATVLEFGCNDGVLLRPLADQGIRTVIGVDPATNVVTTIDDSRVKVVNDYFTEDVARKVVADYGKVDLIMANNVYAHIPDIQGTTRAVAAALAPDGVFAFEVHYLGKVIDEMQYDMVYHEHLYYYSLLSVMNHLARYDMMVFDIKPIPIHAGSIRFYTCKKGSKHGASVSPAVTALEAEERARGFDRYETFLNFSQAVASTRDTLIATLEDLRRKGHRIAGYGASGRANTMIQYCGINHSHLDYMIDDAPAKARYYTPKSHFEIFPSSILSEPDPPDYLLIFAWSFIGEIAKRNQKYLVGGGRMIIPLPEVSIYSPPWDADPVLAQLPSSHRFDWQDCRLEAFAVTERPFDPILADTIIAALRTKVAVTLVALAGNSADDVVAQAVMQLSETLQFSSAMIAEGILLMQSNTLAAHNRSYVDPRNERERAIRAVLDDLSSSLDSLVDCYPGIRRIGANRLALDMLAEKANEVEATIQQVRQRGAASPVVGLSSRAALDVGGVELEGINKKLARETNLLRIADYIETRGSIVASRLLDATNFVSAILQNGGSELAGLSKDTWREIRRSLPKAAAQGVAKGTENALEKAPIVALAYAIAGPFGALAALVPRLGEHARKAKEIKQEIEEKLEGE